MGISSSFISISTVLLVFPRVVDKSACAIRLLCRFYSVFVRNRVLECLMSLTTAGENAL